MDIVVALDLLHVIAQDRVLGRLRFLPVLRWEQDRGDPGEHVDLQVGQASCDVEGRYFVEDWSV